MVSDTAREEMEQALGTVPSFMDALAEPAADHSWGILRDLEFSETELSQREKELVGLGSAVAMQCRYCVHFHTEAAKLEGVSETELTEAVNLAANTRYFSSILHGSQADYDDFVEETAGIVDHIRSQEAVSGSD